MNRGPLFGIFLLAAGLAALAGCSTQRVAPEPAPSKAAKAPAAAVARQSPKTTASGPTAQPLPDEAPLLLADSGPAPAANGGADNSRCFVCHINFQTEQLTLTHAQAGVSCADCHGPSDAHIDDESWARGGNGTPPDKMYTRNAINAFCLHCHKSVSLHTGSPDKVCTDCHGKHRMAKRRFHWK